MHQVQNFRTNFAQDEIVDTATDKPVDAQVDRAELYDTDSSVRNVCFVWENGRKAFFNYAYLVSVDLVITETLNEMLLYFSGQIVTLKGYHLGSLFDLLLNHIPKTITATNPRYHTNGQTTDTIVTDIIVKSE
ncbi:hypothetical protein EXU85_30030 [Spirosoma sp. KCTC 42546]|uniref:hypothetical protein n=1 Tax=Spirosoma sp. KCTC 42546 TaxID=2520506 RepID=UPI001158BD1D|nr:hypothetical protein [Spirosoma sp. KCTC 42546]QDK82619.1 hypothetical protein EXU85_30030 [Spirosoma sp. KCTC 42546]